MIKSTIFAIASGVGKAGITVIRISGLAAADALQKLTRNCLPPPRMAVLKDIYAPVTNHLIDRGIVLWFPAPASFTGEDVVELHVHGSRAVINSLLKALSLMDDLRVAEAGEFSRRAFENGKMDLTQAEGLVDLIDAQTEAQRKQALRQMNGELENLYEQWQERLVSILAQMEAYIDFPDEDLPSNIKNQIDKEVLTLQESIAKHLANKSGEVLREGLSAVIVGAPNVGKSSLLNCLASRDIAIVTETAGTTRDVIEAHLDIDGYPIILCDTAGLRDATCSIESEGIARALRRAANADIKICLFSAETFPCFDAVTTNLIDEDAIVVINKIDKVDIPEDILINNRKALRISVSNGSGTEHLLQILSEKISSKIDSSGDLVFTRERHRTHLTECLQHLEHFSSGTKVNKDIEFCAEDLRLSANALGKLTGKIGVEDLLDKIFSSFCIGK